MYGNLPQCGDQLCPTWILCKRIYANECFEWGQRGSLFQFTEQCINESNQKAHPESW